MKGEFIPVDMVYEILSRVSVPSVLRLKSVCKLWCSVAEDPYFIDMHLERSKSRPPQIIVHRDTQVADGRRTNITFLSHAWFPKLTLRSPYTDSCFYNTRPCNGLICLYDGSTDIRLCNPATREIQVLPNPIQSTCQLCCLGFVPTAKEYKVLRFFRIDSLTSGHHYGCEVLTVGSSSWRRVGDLSCLPIGNGVNLDGSIYLIGLIPPDWDAYLIRFDLTAEDLDMVKLPDLVQYNMVGPQVLVLASRSGKLCLIQRICQDWLFTFTLQGDYKNNIWDRDSYKMMSEFGRWNDFGRASFIGEEGLLYTSGICNFLRFDEVYRGPVMVNDVYEFAESLVPLEKSAMFVESLVHHSCPYFCSAARRTV